MYFCFACQASADVGDAKAFLATLEEHQLPQDLVARMVASLWNAGVAAELGGGGGADRGDNRARELKDMARAFAPYAKRYALYINDKLDSEQYQF